MIKDTVFLLNFFVLVCFVVFLCCSLQVKTAMLYRSIIILLSKFSYFGIICGNDRTLKRSRAGVVLE